MDEPERKPTKSGEDIDNQETLYLYNKFPDLVWCHILDKLDNASDYFKFCQSFPTSHSLFSGYRTKYLFGNVVKIMVRRLENREGKPKRNLQLPDLLSLRRICKTWKHEVDFNLQNLCLNYKFSTERKIPISQFERDMDNKYGYRFIYPDDYEKFQSHFECTHETTGRNPFITRRIKIAINLNWWNAREPQMNLLLSTCLDMLQNYGIHVWYLHFEAGMIGQTAGVKTEQILDLLKRILQHLPNLRVLRIDLPLNVIVQHDVHRVTDVGNQVPLVKTYEAYSITRPNSRRRSETRFRRRPRNIEESHMLGMAQWSYGYQVPGLLGSSHVANNPQAANNPVQVVDANPQAQRGQANISPIVQQLLQNSFEPRNSLPGLINPIRGVSGAARNPPGQPRRENVPGESCAVPVLPHLRFVDQGKMAFDYFMHIICPNVQSLTQVGVTITFKEDILRFLELPLKLAKLEINLSELDMPWHGIFPLLENRFGESLQNLHIYLPTPTIMCPMKLPKLKVLHLLLDGPVPLDFLLGMSHTLEELYVKIGQMNQKENEKVQREEQRVVFYKHLRQLTYSNIWTKFPKLRKVSVGSHVEIEIMTPFWQCTVEEWKDRKY